MTSDPDRSVRPNGIAEAFEALQAAILDADDAVTSAEVRRAAADRGDVPEPFAGYVDTIHDHAYQVSDRTRVGSACGGCR